VGWYYDECYYGHGAQNEQAPGIWEAGLLGGGREIGPVAGAKAGTGAGAVAEPSSGTASETGTYAWNAWIYSP